MLLKIFAGTNETFIYDFERVWFHHISKLNCAVFFFFFFFIMFFNFIFILKFLEITLLMKTILAHDSLRLHSNVKAPGLFLKRKRLYLDY